MSELKPCPFCGSKALTNIFLDYEDIENLPTNVIDDYDPEVTCENERCIYGWWLSPKDWNTRPIEDELRKRIDELGLELGRKSVELGELVGRNIIWEVINDELKSRRENLERENDRLQEKVSDLLKRIAELEAERRWRIIADGEMPEDRATVLVAFTEYPEQIDILTATYYKRYEGFGGVDNWWDIEGWHSGNVTHWMPLPQPPEERER